MAYRQQNVRSAYRLLIAAICILLILVCGTAQVAHTHADTIFHADCSLCVTAHVVIHAEQSPVAAPSVAVSVFIDRFIPAAVPKTVAAFALFTRPPPVDIVPA